MTTGRINQVASSDDTRRAHNALASQGETGAAWARAKRSFGRIFLGAEIRGRVPRSRSGRSASEGPATGFGHGRVERPSRSAPSMDEACRLRVRLAALEGAGRSLP